MPLLKSFDIGKWKLEMHHEDDADYGLAPGHHTYFNQNFIVRLYFDGFRRRLGDCCYRQEQTCSHVFDNVKQCITSHCDEDGYMPVIDIAWLGAREL